MPKLSKKEIINKLDEVLQANEQLATDLEAAIEENKKASTEYSNTLDALDELLKYMEQSSDGN